MKYGLMTPKSPDELFFSQAKELGYDGVELWVIGYGGAEVWKLTTEAVNDVKKVSEKYGVAVSSLDFSCGQGWAGPTNTNEWKQASEIMERAVWACNQLGAKVMLFTLFGLPNLQDEEAASIAVTGLKQIAKIVEKTEVYLCLEMAMNAEDSMELIRRVGSDYVRIYYDICNAINFNYDAAAEIKELGADMIMQFHVKDSTKQLGEGILGEHFAAAAAAIKDIGFDKLDRYVMVAALELLEEGEDITEAATHAINYLKRHL